MYYHGYTALLSAHDRDQDDVMSFVDIFAPELDVFPWGDLVIPLITLGVGVIGEVSGRSKLGLFDSPWNEERYCTSR